MDGSILNDTKHGLGGLEDNDTSFDDEIIPLINTVLNELVQMGVGVRDYTISDSTGSWSDFLGDDLPHLQAAKTYVILQTRMLFDPPTNSFVMQKMNEKCDEIRWRLNVEMDPGSEGLY